MRYCPHAEFATSIQGFVHTCTIEEAFPSRSAPSSMFQSCCTYSSGNGVFRVEGRGWRYFTQWQRARAFAERIGAHEVWIWLESAGWVHRPLTVRVH
jgi:hypothetical protein